MTTRPLPAVQVFRAVPDKRFMARAIPSRTSNGFTLIELIVVIIVLAVLSAIALPKLLDLGSTARTASVTSMGGAVLTAATAVYAACLMTKPEAANNRNVYVQINNLSTNLHYCWPDAGDYLGVDEIDAWVNYQGFTASLPDSGHTRFELGDAPDPTNCSVTYGDVFNGGPTSVPTVVTVTTGC